MEIDLRNSAAEVIWGLMIQLGIATDPANQTVVNLQPWPVYYAIEPSAPDNCQQVIDTDGQFDGRSMIDGDLWEHDGFQLLVRGRTHKVGWAQANLVRDTFAVNVYRNDVVTVDGNFYRVQAVTHISRILALGFDAPNTKRSLFTVNAMLAFTQIGD
jgi:hypothetical protein